MTRRAVFGVMGSGTATRGSEVYALARRLGAAVGRSGAVLLCGGGAGVMEAAARGAKSAGGATVGILPTSVGTPRPCLDLALFTGLGDGRNHLNVAASDAVFALDGGAGTLSEVALALKAKKRGPKPLLAVAAWRFLADHGFDLEWTDDPEAAVERAYALLGRRPGQLLSTPVGSPDIPPQDRNGRAFRAFVEHDPSAGG